MSKPICKLCQKPVEQFEEIESDPLRMLTHYNVKCHGEDVSFWGPFEMFLNPKVAWIIQKEETVS